MDDRTSGFYIKAAAGGGIRGCNGGGNGSGGTKCGRWNPTAEQVKVLTDLFRSGLRTPSTDQIQRISTQLSFYGKIESKNVFYWFQNHKARERQKRRKVSADGDEDRNEKLVRPDNDKIVSASVNDFGGVIDKADDHNQDRVIQTLPLFPINSLVESPVTEKLRYYNMNDCREFMHYEFGTGTADMDPPPLDLRLSSFI